MKKRIFVLLIAALIMLSACSNPLAEEQSGAQSESISQGESESNSSEIEEPEDELIEEPVYEPEEKEEEPEPETPLVEETSAEKLVFGIGENEYFGHISNISQCGETAYFYTWINNSKEKYSEKQGIYSFDGEKAENILNFFDLSVEAEELFSVTADKNGDIYLIWRKGEEIELETFNEVEYFFSKVSKEGNLGEEKSLYYSPEGEPIYNVLSLGNGWCFKKGSEVWVLDKNLEILSKTDVGTGSFRLILSGEKIAVYVYRELMFFDPKTAELSEAFDFSEYYYIYPGNSNYCFIAVKTKPMGLEIYGVSLEGKTELIKEIEDPVLKNSGIINVYQSDFGKTTVIFDYESQIHFKGGSSKIAVFD